MRSRLALVSHAALIFGVTFVCALCVTAPAHAYREPNTMAPSGCGACHVMVFNGTVFVMSDPPSGGDCTECHAAADPSTPGVGYTSLEVSGPHGNYSQTSRKCAVCHAVHDAPGESVLLGRAATVVATCETCHDGTGGWGVYGTLDTLGVTAEGGHSCEVTNLVPGGDASTGGTTTGDFGGPGDTLVCTDCHTPHGSNTVEPFLGERRRLRQNTPAPVSSRLLKQQPTGATTAVTEYGADWCLACHAGRSSGGSLHNHPVESALTWADPATRFVYDRLALLDGAGPTGSTVIGSLGGTPCYTPPADPDLQHKTGFVNTAGNRGFLMPIPRTTGAAGQDGHFPICQQCHEDARDVGDLDAATGVGQAVPFVVTNADGVEWNGSAWVASTDDNPRFQNFPHETENAFMLVETRDDLCLNCHTLLP